MWEPCKLRSHWQLFSSKRNAKMIVVKFIKHSVNDFSCDPITRKNQEMCSKICFVRWANRKSCNKNKFWTKARSAYHTSHFLKNDSTSVMKVLKQFMSVFFLDCTKMEFSKFQNMVFFKHFDQKRKFEGKNFRQTFNFH